MFSHILYKNYDVRSANYLPCLRHVAHISKFRKVNKMGIFLSASQTKENTEFKYIEKKGDFDIEI